MLCEPPEPGCIYKCLLTYLEEYKLKNMKFVFKPGKPENSFKERMIRMRRDVSNAKGNLDQSNELYSESGSQNVDDLGSGEIMDLPEIVSQSSLGEEGVGVTDLPIDSEEDSYSTTEMPEDFDSLVSTEIPLQLVKGSSVFKSPRRIKFDESLEPFNLKDLAAASIDYEPLDSEETFDESGESRDQIYQNEHIEEMKNFSMAEARPDARPEIFSLLENGHVVFRGIEYDENCVPVHWRTLDGKVASLYNCRRYYEFTGPRSFLDAPCFDEEVFDSDSESCVVPDDVECIEYPPCVEMFAKQNLDSVRPVHHDKYKSV